MRARAAAVLAICGLSLPLASADGPAVPSALTETLEKRLVQFDVGVEGDPEVIRGLTAKDFVLKVDRQRIRGLVVDSLCGETSPSDSAAESDRASESSRPQVLPRVTRRPATFIFYFDQPHLTQAGRELSLETARELIDRLVVDGGRASIVSSADRLQTIVRMTGDREKLQAGLVKLRADLEQWDTYASTEDARAADVLRALRPCQVAKRYAQEEWREAKRTTERLGITAGALAQAPEPKGLVYFGDNLRQAAGQHYLQIGCGPTSFEFMSGESVASAALQFDAAIEEALARGVHLFTIQAEGLLPYRPGWDAERHHQAQDALVGLAAETGGEAFLGGASNEYIADRISTMTSCRLLLSFPPGDLYRDQPLIVTVKLRVQGVKIQAQGRIVIPSPESIERARLFAAFVDPASSDNGSLRALLVPRGGDGKVWNVAVQLRLRPSGLPENSAELGASIVRQDAVEGQFAASIATKNGARAIVLEKRLDIAPGRFSVVAVARDAKRGDVGSTRVDADWPSAAKNPAAIAPIAALQTGPAAMSRDGAVGSSGLLARDVDELLDPAASITLETVVCRGAKTTKPIVVERWVENGTANEFAAMTIEPTSDPCIQIVDVLRAGRVRPGVVDYRVTARIGDEVVAQERRELRVGSTTDPR